MIGLNVDVDVANGGIDVTSHPPCDDARCANVDIVGCGWLWFFVLKLQVGALADVVVPKVLPFSLELGSAVAGRGLVK